MLQFVYVQDKKRAFQELHQVLKPNGGKAIVTVIRENSYLGLTILLQVLPEWKQHMPSFFDMALSMANEKEVQELILQSAPFTSCNCNIVQFGHDITFEQFVGMYAGLLQHVGTLYPDAPQAWHQEAQKYNKNGMVQVVLVANVFEIVK